MSRGAGHDRVLWLPYRGAPQTVGVITDAALRSQSNYAVRELAEAICAGLPSKAYLDEYLAIYYFCLGHTRYMRDPRTVELVRAPYLLAQQILAGETPSVDCDDLAGLIAALDLAVGGACRVTTVAFRNVYYRGQRQFSHVFTEAQEPRTGQWLVQDPVAAHKTRQMLRRVVAARFYPVA